MALPLDYTRNSPTAYARPQQALTATSMADSIKRIVDLIRRRQTFNVGVPDTQYFPFAAICRLQMTFPDEAGTWQGTGFYISDELILSAGHNFISKGGKPATKVVVQPGYNNGHTFPEFTVRANQWEVHPKYANGKDSGFDMGVIHAPKTSPTGDYFELINYSPVPGTKLALSGYGLSGTVSQDIQHLDIATFKGLSHGGEMLTFDIYALGGHSGSPCFVDFEPNRTAGFEAEHMPVMAILQGGHTDLNNQGVLLTPEKIDWAKGGGRMSVAQSLGRIPGPGGLPIVPQTRTMLGGLPLLPASGRAPAYVPMHPATPPAPPPAPQPGTPPIAAEQSYHARALGRSWIVADPDRGMSIEKRTFGKKANDLTGKTKLTVIIRDMPAGGSVRWNIPNADDRTRVLFETGGKTSQSASGTSVTLRSLAPGVARVDCMVSDASGKTIESNKYLVSSPHFVKVVFDSTVDTYLGNTNLDTRRAAIIAEMRAVTSLLYENVNVRFVMPGDTFPAHLDNGANADFPGGREVASSVSIINVRGDVQPVDPEETHTQGVETRFALDEFGRNHSPGELPAPLDNHNISTVLLAHYRHRHEIAGVEDAVSTGTETDANLDAAATMFGRLLGETAAHEWGHNTDGAFRRHNRDAAQADGWSRDGVMARGRHRTLAERTGMARAAAPALLVDNGTAGINRLNDANLRAMEEVLPVLPPLDAAAERSRGRVGSFSHRAFGGDTTVHLPGATVLTGAQAEMALFLLEKGLEGIVFTSMPHLGLLASMVIDLDTVLDICDAQNVSIGLGEAFGGGLAAGGSGGFGIVFAPGRRVGFYGSLSGLAGWVASVGAMLQLTIVQGGPENFAGSSYTIGVTVETIGWLDAGLIGMPVGAHAIFNTSGKPIGATFEIGISVGVPTLSLIEVVGQKVWTESTIDLPAATAQPGTAPAMAQTVDPGGELRAAVIAHGITNGATPEAAAEFADTLFQ